MDPALSNSEVQQLIKSVNRKGYDKYTDVKMHLLMPYAKQVCVEQKDLV